MTSRETTLAAVAGLAALAFAGLIHAQDGAGDPAADAAPAAEASAETASAEPAAAPVKPRAAEMMRLASRGLLLDVTNSGKHLIAVGDRGTILASNNSRDWAQLPSPVRSPLTGVAFADDNIGYVVGHDAVILKTTDGGKNWVMQHFEPELEKPLLDVITLGADHVIAVGAYGLMLQTTDGGSTWAEVDAPAIRGEELHINAITKLGNGQLMVVGEQGTIGLSSDNGTSWEKITAPYDGSLYGAIAMGDGGALIYGLRGNVYKTDNVKGAAWTQVDVQTVSSFFGGTTLADGSVALVGLAGKAIKLDAAGTTSELRVTTKQTDANGNTSDKDVTGSFAGAVNWAGQLVLVGEQGVQSVKIN